MATKPSPPGFGDYEKFDNEREEAKRARSNGGAPPNGTPAPTPTVAPKEVRRYITDDDYRRAVADRETEILDALDIPFRSGRPHFKCRLPGHKDEHPSSRWDPEKRRLYCTCSQGLDIASVVMKLEGLNYAQAKLRVAEILGRQDLIRTTGTRGPQWYLNPPASKRDDSLPLIYLGHRLGVPPAKILRPRTPIAGWSKLGYYDGGRDHRIGDFPCAVFSLINAEGRSHAQRIYLKPDGQGKAETPGGRNPKKAVPLPEEDRAGVAGCCVFWGDPAKAHTIFLCEEIETAQAVTQAHAVQIALDRIAVVATVSASWMPNWKPWPANKTVIIVADRDEARDPRDKGFKAGEKAAHKLAAKLVSMGLRVLFALPGEPGSDCDALNVWEKGDAAAVRALIGSAQLWSPEQGNDPEPRADRIQKMQDEKPVRPNIFTDDINGPELDRHGREHMDADGSSAAQSAAGDGPGEPSEADLFRDARAGCEPASGAAQETDAPQNPRPDDSRPRIRLADHELPRVVDETEAALIVIGGIYERSGQLVRPIRMRVPAADDRQTTSHRLGLVSASHVAETATRAAIFEKYDARERKWRPVACPLKIAETFLARLEWKLPLLVGITSAPMLRPNGSLLDKPGYDAHTCLIFDPGETAFPPIPDHPTIEQARVALDFLTDLLSEFSFAEPVDQAVALAAILTALVRRSLPSAPMFGITAPDFGYGKTYLADVVAAIGSAAICPVTAQGERSEELDKHLDAALIGGADLLCIDNVSRPLSSERLCQMLTQRMVRVRILGSSTVVDISTATTMLATGINLQIADDLVRRTLLCRLAADIERPETRQFNKRPLDAIAADRGKFVAAGLTMMLAYIAAGRPLALPVLGSFEAWCRMVRNPLCWLGLPDITETIAKTRAGDSKFAQLAAMLDQWDAVIGGTPVTAKELVNAAFQQEPDGGGSDRFTYPALADATRAVASEKGGNISTHRLGLWLRNVAGKIVDGRRIAQAGEDRHHVRTWKLERLEHVSRGHGHVGECGK